METVTLQDITAPLPSIVTLRDDLKIVNIKWCCLLDCSSTYWINNSTWNLKETQQQNPYIITALVKTRLKSFVKKKIN